MKHQPSGMLSVAVLYVQYVYVDVHMMFVRTIGLKLTIYVDHVGVSIQFAIRVSFVRTVGIPVVKVLCSLVWSATSPT